MFRSRDAPIIIVGAGACGAVIASRVTERSDREVLLVEAGPDYGPNVPFDVTNGRRNSMGDHDWGFWHWPSTKLPHPLFFPRGRVVGGSSAVNTCIALRGQPYDYDEWASRGLKEWSFEQCLPAFKRLEHDLDIDNEWHGQDGPIPIRRHRPEELVPWQAAFLEACRIKGYPSAFDVNDPRSSGAGPHAMNKVNGERMSVARGYLGASVRRRKNLKILARTTVRRVLFHNRRAVGIEVESGDWVRTLPASLVVLSAGAIGTPGILLRSGVGPLDVLHSMGAPLISEVPAVGRDLLDHPGAGFLLRPKHRDLIDYENPLVQTVCRYTAEGSPYPNDTQLQPGSFVPIANREAPLVSLVCVVGKPKGKGKLTYRTMNAREKPRIESRLFEHEDDRRIATNAIERLLELSHTPPLADLATIFWPTAKMLSSRERIDARLRIMCDSGYHPCGTVPMGADDDPGAATDGRGRVRGTEGLVVADASLMPTIPMANTHLTVVMMGERFGDWLSSGDE